MEILMRSVSDRYLAENLICIFNFLFTQHVNNVDEIFRDGENVGTVQFAVAENVGENVYEK